MYNNFVARDNSLKLSIIPSIVKDNERVFFSIDEFGFYPYNLCSKKDTIKYCLPTFNVGRGLIFSINGFVNNIYLHEIISECKNLFDLQEQIKQYVDLHPEKIFHFWQTDESSLIVPSLLHKISVLTG